MMSSNKPPIVSDLVLIGGGHAHVHVLKMLGMPPHRSQLEQAGIRVTLITNTLLTPYSGMLPGYLAGHYTYEQIHLDLHQLCRFSNIRLIHASAEMISYDHGTGSVLGSSNTISGWITCRDAMTGELRPPVRYDCLSIDVGITPSTLPENHSENNTKLIIPVKPIANFCAHYQQLQQRVLLHIQQAGAINKKTPSLPQQQQQSPEEEHHSPDEQPTEVDHTIGSSSSSPLPPDPFTILVVGGGAGGLEVALSVQHRLHQLLVSSGSVTPDASYDTLASHVQIILATRGSTLLEEHNRQVQTTMLRVLKERHIQIRYHASIVSVREQQQQQQQTASSNNNQRVKKVATLAETTTPPDTQQNQHSASKHSNSNHNNGIYNDNLYIECDECLWCTSAVAPSWLSTHTPFVCTETGSFIQVTSTLQSLSHPGVFAAGDCCHMSHAPRPKAGVFAVRAGPILLHNLVAYLLTGNKHLRSYHPQKSFLVLISTGDDYAIASKGKYFCVKGKWVWKWKDYIDRTFMAKYQDKLAELHHDMMEQQHASLWHTLRLAWRQWYHVHRAAIPRHVQLKGSAIHQAFNNADPMRCGGCGAKVGSNTLSRVLSAIQQRQISRRVHRELQQQQKATPTTNNELLDHDDVAVVPLPPNPQGGNMVYTLDYFRSMISDPYLFGKICAIHALSDIHAMGVATTTTTTTTTPPTNDEDVDERNSPSITALALCVVPFCADESVTESTLMDLLSGGSDVLQDEHVRLVGGHTCEGMELACGFSIQGYVPRQVGLFRKRGGRIGDQLVLTKPIGTGALMAADMRVKIKAAYMEEALTSMLRSNGPASRIAASASYVGGIRACTDVTGFGLVGHLLEMLMANEDTVHIGNKSYDSIGARIHLSAIPMLQGALAASSQEIFSTLQASNHHNRHAVANHAEASKIDPIRYPLIFDPQTAGGLLFMVDPDVCHAFVADLETYYPDVSIIGELVEFSKRQENHETALHGIDQEEVCTIGSGGHITGKRIHIVL